MSFGPAAAPEEIVAPNGGRVIAVSSKRDLATTWRIGIAVAAAGLTPVLAYFGNLGFAPAVALAGLLCLPLLARARRPSRGMWLLLALLAWALASEVWSVAVPRAPDLHRYKSLEQLTGLKLVFQLALYSAFVVGVRDVSPGGGRLAGRVLGLGLAALSGVMLVDALSQGGLYGLVRADLGFAIRSDLARRDVARACYVMTLLFWPAALALWRSRFRALAYVLAALTLLTSAMLQVDAPLAAFFLSALVYAVVRGSGRAGIWLSMLATLAYFALTPIVVGLLGHIQLGKHAVQLGKLSWGLRLTAWGFVDKLIVFKPLFGWGLDASRMWPRDIPLHPHDAAMQLWFELGAVGAGLTALFYAWLHTRIAAVGTRDRDMAAAGCATMTAYLIIGALSFGVWQEWWLALGALAAAACAIVAAGRSDDEAHAHDDGLIPLV